MMATTVGMEDDGNYCRDGRWQLLWEWKMATTVGMEDDGNCCRDGR